MTVALLLAVIAAAPRSTPVFDHFGGGGTSVSPDGRWRIWSRPADDDIADSAPAWLSGPGVRRRRLLRYERALYVTWMADRRHVILKDQDTHLATLSVFDLEAGNTQPAGRAERMMEASLTTVGSRLAAVENREIVYGRAFATEPCVTVRESGLPFGQDEGSFVTRQAAFRLDLRSYQATRIPRCDGAVPAR